MWVSNVTEGAMYGVYCHDNFLAQKLLSDMHRFAQDEFCVFQPLGTPAHRARDTVAFSLQELPDFIFGTLWPPNCRIITWSSGRLQYLMCAAREGCPLRNNWPRGTQNSSDRQIHGHSLTNRLWISLSASGAVVYLLVYVLMAHIWSTDFGNVQPICRETNCCVK